jgi:hypothetical protein
VALGKFKMKINEVTVKEASVGQLWAGAKGAYQGWQAAGQPNQPVKPGDSGLDTAINTLKAKPNTGILGKIGGAFQGAKAGYQIAGAEQAQSKQIKDITTQVSQKWGAYNQKIKTNTGNDATREQAVAWLTQFFGGQKPTSQPAGDNPNPVQIQQWLQKEVAGYMANQEVAAEPPAELPDITKLNREELLQLKQQLQAA